MSTFQQVVESASQDRLAKLIEARLKPGADKAAIDRRIWDLFGEDWAVMFTDLSGFSRKVEEFGIIHFLQVIHESERLFIPLIDHHDGILMKVEGDSLLVLFRSARSALECSIDMQRAARDYNKDRSDAEKVLVCVGLGCGRLIKLGDRDVFGAEVNAASKLGEDTAKAWEILVTGAVQKSAEGMPGVRFEPIAEVPPGAKAAFRVLYSL